jgi:hypothetical protein
MYDDEDSSSISRALSVNIQSGWNGSENHDIWGAVGGEWLGEDKELASMTFGAAMSASQDRRRTSEQK